MISLTKLMRQILTERMSFRDLLRGSERGRKDRSKHVSARSMRVTSTDEGESWLFNYKSQGNHSTTGTRWHGHIQFFKENVSTNENVENLDCKVSCDCPDYTFRYAYNNNKAEAGNLGKNNGQKWRPRSQGGVGDYGVGLCKHLCVLSEYLKTTIEPNAPTPDDKPPLPDPKKPVDTRSAAQKSPTTAAPKPHDSYSDSRSGSDTLQEGQRSQLYNKMDAFVNSNPQFTLPIFEE